MNLERIQEIKEKCMRLRGHIIDRTEGKWRVEYEEHQSGAYTISSTYVPLLKVGKHIVAEGFELEEKHECNLEFIADSANHFVALLETTIIAINILVEYATYPLTAGVERQVAIKQLEKIEEQWKHL